MTRLPASKAGPAAGGAPPPTPVGADRQTTGSIYADYDQLIRRVEQWVAARRLRIGGCDERQVRARLVQRVVQLSCDEYSRQALRRDPAGWPARMSLGEVELAADTGEIHLPPGSQARQLGAFMAGWLRSLGLLLATLEVRPVAAGSAPVLLMDSPAGLEVSDEGFARFCREGPVAPLSADHLIVAVQRSPTVVTDPRICYAPHPLFALIARHADLATKLRLLAAHLAAPFHFLRALVSCPACLILARDMALVPLVRILDRHGLIRDMLISTSSFTGQPLWMKGIEGQRFKLHLVWYSQNFVPKMYQGEKLVPDLPQARHMRLDISWVWTPGFAEYLRRLGLGCECRVVGPILWFLPETLPPLGPQPIKIALFDITPIPDGATPFGAFKNYYSVATISRFVRDILAVCDEIESVTGRTVLILLKHKRAPKTGWHAREYLDYIDGLARERPGFRLVDHNANLFGLIVQCDLSISVPYTSTAYVAASLGKPALYYDPGGELVPVFEPSPWVRFAGSESELRHEMQRVLAVLDGKLPAGRMTARSDGP